MFIVRIASVFELAIPETILSPARDLMVAQPSSAQFNPFILDFTKQHRNLQLTIVKTSDYLNSLTPN